MARLRQAVAPLLATVGNLRGPLVGSPTVAASVRLRRGYGGQELREHNEIIGRPGGCGDSFLEFLDAKLLVHERAVFLKDSERRQQNFCRGARGVRVRAEVNDGNSSELRSREAGGGEIFADGDHSCAFARIDLRGEVGQAAEANV